MFDLRAKNKGVDDVQFSWFFWRQIMEQTGAGYVLGVGFYGDDPGKYVYSVPSVGGGSPMSNDGYEVTEAEAKAMAMCCRGYVAVKRYIEADSVIYREIERFAEFAECSGGFRID
jgi:hypothetical protein